jgi:hypothetical protein
MSISNPTQLMIGGDVDYSSRQTQEDIESMLQALENSTYFREDSYTQSWIRSFLSFVQWRNDLRSPMDNFLDVSNKTEFNRVLQEVQFYCLNKSTQTDIRCHNCIKLTNHRSLGVLGRREQLVAEVRSGRE